MKINFEIFLTLIIIVCINILPSYAFKEETHSTINEYIVQGTTNGFSLENYLKTQLGFQKGVKEGLQFGESKMVLNWIGDGGKTEDVPDMRSGNHFHDPISNKGFDGIFFGILFKGDSSIIWSQKPIGVQNPGGYYSWFDTRDYFYKALISTIKADREKYFAETFRGIGQLMHLVQDVSVPAHTRNQAHIGYHYEGFVLNYQNELYNKYKGQFKTLLANPISFDQSLLNLTSSLAPLPFANIFDSEKYADTNPDPAVTLSSNIGLSEYTNANFFSDNTIFKNYPHPAKENTSAILIEQIVEDGEIDNSYYIKGYQSEQLALYSYFAKLDISGTPEGWKYTLDDAVYEDYAQKLIPRAVGYSSGLLDYFFRGNIEITLPDSGVYAQTNNPAAGFTQIKLLAKNTSSTGEQMTDGSIELVVKYSPSTTEFSYIVVPEANGLRFIPQDMPVELNFDLSQSQIPFNATDLYLQVVYQGKLGNEDGAVAVGFKDISEPTPIDICNNMDKICMNNTWYNAGSLEAIALVDKNGDGKAYGYNEWDVYPHILNSVYIRVSPASNSGYASPTEYNYQVSNIAAPGFSRAVYILTDYTFNYSFYAVWSGTNSDDQWYHSPWTTLYAGTAIKNQMDYVTDPEQCDGNPACYITYVPGYYTFRGVQMWWGGGVVFLNPEYPSGSSCAYELL